MSGVHGFDLLHAQILDRADIWLGAFLRGAEHAGHMGDTPIERLFMSALYTSLKFVEQEWFKGIIVSNPDKMPDERNHILVERQVQLKNWRVDFLLHAYADWGREPDAGRLPGWRRLIVECDGHDFHERTKEQASKDRGRDRSIQLDGYEVFRFTGSELWRDPIGCANQVIEWANKGV
jgi:very-short-patch-repair endonuclease